MIKIDIYPMKSISANTQTRVNFSIRLILKLFSLDDDVVVT